MGWGYGGNSTLARSTSAQVSSETHDRRISRLELQAQGSIVQSQLASEAEHRIPRSPHLTKTLEHLLQERESLDEELEEWQTAQEQQMLLGKTSIPAEYPDEAVGMKSASSEEVGSDPFAIHIIGLPSDFSLDEQTRLGLAGLAEVELQARIGLAYDLIEEVCQSCNWAQAAQRETAAVSSSAQATRSAELHREAHASTRTLVNLYNKNREVLLALGLDEHHARLRFMDVKSDLQKHDNREKRSRKQGQVLEGWIWNVGDASLEADGVKGQERNQFREEGE